MLLQLQVKNYAIIDEVTISFNQGLNIITGETGAGKSILLGALGLVLGDRADLNALFNPDKKCIIEGEFDIGSLELKDFFESHELDFEKHLILRRELLPTLRSRAFINDTPVKLKTLQALSEQLINVHRQFATLDIFTRSFQTKILDTLAEQQAAVHTYQNVFGSYKKNILEKKSLEEHHARASKENDFISFQVNEIREFDPDPQHDDQIHHVLKNAENADEVEQEIRQIEMILNHGEQNLSEMLHGVQQKMIHLVKLNERFTPLSERIASIKIDLDDVGSELHSLSLEQQTDPNELAELTKRYDALQRLFFKHQVSDTSTLLELLDEMENKIKSNIIDEERIQQLTHKIKVQEEDLIKQAKKISKKRHAQAPVLKQKVELALDSLAMSNAEFSVQIEDLDQLSSQGTDKVEFLFSANPGSKLQPLQDAASGGELSRLSLALKSIIAHELALPTMVFDEIDSGVSGDTALRMGHMLKGLGSKHQTIVITHSPQVAAQGSTHHFVSKSTANGSTKTHITLLAKEERLEKIAIMLSSDPPTRAARKNAQELLNN